MKNLSSLGKSLADLERKDPSVRAASKALDNTTRKILAGPPLLIFDEAEIEEAADSWGFSCGPAALCALLSRSPDGIRGHLGDFKGYMNPSMMYAALRALEAQWCLSERHGDHGMEFPRFGIIRIQWGGPWLQPKVPIPARYKRTHWAAVCAVPGSAMRVFDVNSARCEWMKFREWKSELIPSLIEQVPKADGTWTITHAIEVVR